MCVCVVLSQSNHTISESLQSAFTDEYKRGSHTLTVYLDVLPHCEYLFVRTNVCVCVVLSPSNHTIGETAHSAFTGEYE